MLWKRKTSQRLLNIWGLCCGNFHCDWWLNCASVSASFLGASEGLTGSGWQVLPQNYHIYIYTYIIYTFTYVHVYIHMQIRIGWCEPGSKLSVISPCCRMTTPVASSIYPLKENPKSVWVNIPTCFILWPWHMWVSVVILTYWLIIY